MSFVKDITVYDIAKEANVSVSTVSRVINGTAPVKDSTRKKVMDLIEKYQFQPNALARSLLKKETSMIGVVLPNITNPFFPEVVLGAENVAREEGYTLFLCNSMGDFELESQYLSILQEKQVDGILFLGGRINLQRCPRSYVEEVSAINKRIPIMLINGNLPRSGCHLVSVDEYEGAKIATQHLIDLGHQDIAFIGGSRKTLTTVQKIKGYRHCLEENGILFREDRVIQNDSYSIQDGKKIMDQILSQKDRPSAVFCVNDFTAIGAIKSLWEKGLKVPEDMAVCGFDDTLLANSITPELTTVSQKSEELGRTAMQNLLRVIRKEKQRKKTIIQPELIIRKSTTP